MIALLLEGVPNRGLHLLAGLLLALIAVPLVAGDYLITVLILILYFAYVGQAWNIMMGFAGQLSLGHALYVGLGAYAAAALYVYFGLSPWIGLWAAMAASAAAGAVIGFLAFRFGVAGVYFAILTIAFAEFARIGFDHWSWLGGSAGSVPARRQLHAQRSASLRGSPTMFYYVALAMTAAAFVLCHALLKSRMGYYWLAIRESPEAAQALGIDIFRYKMVAVVISAGHDLARRRAVRLLLQQPVPRAGLPHLALHRADPGPHHRRHRHPVRADRRRVPLDRAVGDPARGDAAASASTCPASSRCSTEFACCSW